MLQNKAALVSFPRSGRHLMHTLLSRGFGFPDHHIDRGNPSAGNHQFVVSHDISLRQDQDGRRCLVMIRCPLESLISFHKLMNPEDQNRERFEWSLFAESNPTTTNRCGWVAYWKKFADHHVLSRDYPNPRLILGYKTLVSEPHSALRNVAKFFGGGFAMGAALKHPIRRHSTLKEHPIYQDESLVERITAALEPQLSAVKGLGVI